MEKEGSPKPSLVRHPRSSADVSSCQVVFACSALRLARRIAFVLLLACLLSALLSADPGLPERWGKGDVGSPYSVANLIDGNQTTVIPVVAWQGRGLPVNLTLIHNSHAASNSPMPLIPLGNGWTHSYNLAITDNGGTAVLREGDGRQRTFTASGGGNYTAPAGIYDTLVKNANNTFTLTRKDGTRLNFNAANKLASIVDLNGNTVTLTYTGNHLTAIADPTGRQLTLAYNGSGYITSLTDPANRTWQVTYSGNLLQQLRDPATRTFTFAYAQGKITTLTDRRGYAWTFAYNAGTPPRVTSVTNPLQGVRSYGYAPVQVTNERGHRDEFAFDGAGNWVGFLQGFGSGQIQTSYTYDANHNQTSMQKPLGNTWQFTYDARGNLLTASDPYNNTTTTVWNSLNRPTSVTDPMGHQTVLTWDAKGNLTQTRDAANYTTTYTVNGYGQVTAVTNARNYTTALTYTANGDVATVTDPLNHQTSYGYSPLGWVTSVQDALGRTTGLSYDTAGRPTLTTYPDSSTRSASYDNNDNVTGLTDENGKSAGFTYDALSRLTAKTNALAQTASYAYNAAGSITAVTDGNNHTRNYTYDELERLTRLDLPDNTWESFAYDTNSRLASKSNSRNVTVLFGYDNADRLTGIDYPAGTADVSFGYNADGLRTGMADGHGATTWSYDARHLPTGVASPQGTVSYAYNAVGSRANLAVAGVGSTAYSYDAADRLTSLTNPYNETTGYVYDIANRLTRLNRANGTYATYAYHARDWVTRVTHKNSGNGVLADYQYSYDPAGHLTQIAETNGPTTTYGYNDVYQLTAETRTGGGGYTISYSYDANQNRLSKVLNGVTESYSYDAADKLLTAGSKSYSYDGAGNLTGVLNNGQTTTLSYDAANRLTQVTYPGGSNQFGYNGLSQRIGKTDSTGTFTYLYDGSSVVVDGAAYYTRGTGGLLSERRNYASRWYQADALTGTRSLTNASQTITDTFSSDAFGLATARTGSTPTPYRYGGGAGYQAEADTGVYRLGYRVYDPSMGRFVTRDPVQDGLNWYAYVGNNPLASLDPLGLFYREGGMMLGTLVGGMIGGGLPGAAIGAGIGSFLGSLLDGESLRRSLGLGLIDGGMVMISGAVLSKAMEGLAPVLGRWMGGACFVAGTPVLLADGGLKPIEQVQVGEKVLTQESASGPVTSARVRRTFERQADSTVVLHLATGEAIEATAEHPFYVAGRGFVAAQAVGIGTAIVTRAGPAVRVVGVERQAGRVRVYNLEVEGAHTYFVGKTGAWVHNICYPPNNGFAGEPIEVTLREGQMLWRYGDDVGRFVTEPGTPPGNISLPPNKPTIPTPYIVKSDIENVLAGPAMPWFGQPGAGRQYLLPAPIRDLIAKGLLEPF